METLSPEEKEFYDTTDTNLLCRLCCKTSNISLIPLYIDGAPNDNLASKIKSYLPINVLPEDLLPTKICFKCASSLIVWDEFFQSCLSTDKRLRAVLARKTIHCESQENKNITYLEKHAIHSIESFAGISVRKSANGTNVGFKEEVQLKDEIEDHEHLIMENWDGEQSSCISYSMKICGQLSEKSKCTTNNIRENETENLTHGEEELNQIQELEDAVELKKENDLVSQRPEENNGVYHKECFQTKITDKKGKSKRPILYHRTSLEQKKILIKQIYEEGKTIAEAAIIAGVNKNTAKNLVKIYREDGEEIIQRQWGRKNNTKLTTAILNKIEQLIEGNPSLTLRTIQKLLAEDNIHISTSTIHNGLKDLKITLKLDRFYGHKLNFPQSIEERRNYAKMFLENIPANLTKCIFIDECGFNFHQGKPVRMSSGKCVSDITVFSPSVKGRFVTLIAAMNNEGIIHSKVLSNGVCSTIKFCDFLNELIEVLAVQEDIQNAWIIVDNASIHNTTGVKQLLAQTNLQLKFLPWYSPILNPLEGVFKKVKILGKVILNNPTLNQSLLQVVKEAIESVTAEDCASFVSYMMTELTKTAEDHPLG